MKCDFGRTIGKGGKMLINQDSRRKPWKTMVEREEMGKGYMAIGEEEHVQWLGAFWDIYIS